MVSFASCYTWRFPPISSRTHTSSPIMTADTTSNINHQKFYTVRLEVPVCWQTKMKGLRENKMLGLGSAALLARLYFFMSKSAHQFCTLFRKKNAGADTLSRKTKVWCSVKMCTLEKLKLLWWEEHKPHLQRVICNTFSENKHSVSRWENKAAEPWQSLKFKGLCSWPLASIFQLLIWPSGYPDPSSVCTIRGQSIWHYRPQMS